MGEGLGMKMVRQMRWVNREDGGEEEMGEMRGKLMMTMTRMMRTGEKMR